MYHLPNYQKKDSKTQNKQRKTIYKNTNTHTQNKNLSKKLHKGKNSTATGSFKDPPPHHPVPL